MTDENPRPWRVTVDVSAASIEQVTAWHEATIEGVDSPDAFGCIFEGGTIGPAADEDRWQRLAEDRNREIDLQVVKITELRKALREAAKALDSAGDYLGPNLPASANATWSASEAAAQAAKA